ncbi:MAG: electron transfer flavoprotein subunit beta/FixA family protein [Armatimonadetes bacterium]|nr:electron transfer flavoprotein subunit beta/FixA family protein [Armatimonadota bacterium]
MRILVPLKRVPDPYARIRLNADGSDIETTGLKFEINPFDEIAVEEAVRIKERATCEIVVVSIGKPVCEEQLRKALAIGADRALLVETDAAFDSLGIAKVLNGVMDREKPDMVIMGKQAIDDDNNQVGQMLAAIRGLPQATFASEVALSGNSVSVTRETDTGQETLEMPLPAIITTDLRLNEPRYIALPGIIKARNKPLDRISLADLGVDPECRVRVTELRQPPPRKAGRKVDSVDELIAALRDEARVIR